MLKRLMATVFCIVILITAASVSSSAATFVPYLGYEYNQEEESVPAPVGYEPEFISFGSDMGAGDLKEPKDICFYNDELYILDSGNSRIVVTDRDLKLSRIIGELNFKSEIINYTGAEGLFVCHNGNILIADTASGRIIETDNNGEVLNLLTKPDTPMISEDLVYSVKKVIRDYNGVTYALVDGINEGAVTYMNDGSFGGFFAMNTVKQTAEALLNYVWKRFMTEEQIRNSANASPSSITNFDLAEKSFIYTVTQSSEGESSVRLLNFKGSNLETENEFGDLEWDRKIKGSVSTAFCDVDVDGDNYVYLLDSSRGRVFVYSEEGRLITIFGGMGEKMGNFLSASAIETNKDRVYVLDTARNGITVFRENEYVSTVKTAQNLLDEGKYAESKEYWEKVLTLNANSTVAYYGIGLALDEAGQYKEALRYFKLAYSNKGYSNAFKEVRKEIIKDNFVLLIFGAAALIVITIVAAKFLKKKFGRKNAYERSLLEGKYTAPLFTMFHPFDGYNDLKTKKAWSSPLAFGILVALFLSLTAKWFLTGFSFNLNRASDYNVFITLLQAFGIVLVCAIANWAVCTLIEGKGRFTDIICMIIYSLVPYIISILLSTVFSNVLTLEEDAFIAVINLIGIIWTGVLIFVGFMSIHQFSFSKNVLSIVMTAIGIAIIVFLMILFVGLMQQVISFIKSIVSEIVIMS